MISLLYVIYLYYDYTNRLVVGIVVDLGNVPIVGEEDEELVGIAVVETSLRLVVIIMDHVRTILAVGLAGKVVDDAEPFHALHDILEVDVLVVALALSLLQRSVLAVFYADGEVRTRNLMLALWNRQEIGLGDVFEERLPLLGILLILLVEVYQVDTGVRVCLGESVSPGSLLGPFLCLLHQLGIVGIGCSVKAFLSAAVLAGSLLRMAKTFLAALCLCCQKGTG